MFLRNTRPVKRAPKFTDPPSSSATCIRPVGRSADTTRVRSHNARRVLPLGRHWTRMFIFLALVVSSLEPLTIVIGYREGLLKTLVTNLFLTQRGEVIAAERMISTDNWEGRQPRASSWLCRKQRNRTTPKDAKAKN